MARILKALGFDPRKSSSATMRGGRRLEDKHAGEHDLITGRLNLQARRLAIIDAQIKALKRR